MPDSTERAKGSKAKGSEVPHLCKKINKEGACTHKPLMPTKRSSIMQENKQGRCLHSQAAYAHKTLLTYALCKRINNEGACTHTLLMPTKRSSFMQENKQGRCLHSHAAYAHKTCRHAAILMSSFGCGGLCCGLLG